MQRVKNLGKQIPKVFLAGSLLILILVGLVIFGIKRGQPVEVHYHAGFRIYENNQLVDFSGTQYMHIKPCSKDEAHESAGNDPRERAHLHDGIGDVVHVHRADATWGDLFAGLGFHPEGTVTYYINGQPVGDVNKRVIAAYDRLLILVGKNDRLEEKLQSVPDKAKVEEAEQKTEGC